MSIIGRLISVIRQNMNGAINKLEDPVKKLDLEIEDLDQNILEVRKSIAPVLGKNTRMKKDIESCIKEIEELTSKIDKL